ncbi:hypothetical protein V6K52_00520 [Knoellia sp. S7-12]|uniref:hypothetical protein n=1 Tax=Knoellia sp. S7-12 TaxID=3126698 RepID=UPI003366E85C
MRRAIRGAAVAVISSGFLLAGASAGQAVGDAPGQRATAAAEQFWCGKQYTVVNRVTYGGAGWIQLTGQADNGDRAIQTFHPTGRQDQYQFRFTGGLVVGPVAAHDFCIQLAAGHTARPEARNGGQWWEGQWRQG